MSIQAFLGSLVTFRSAAFWRLALIMAVSLIMMSLNMSPGSAEDRRSQDPKPPYPYAEEEVGYENKAAGVKLAGTLTLPRGQGPFPAVILINGSGINDRNETIAGHHPFWVLADYLTRRGIAVLRVDKRGVGGSTGSVANSTTEDFADDVLAGVDYLKHRSEVNPQAIGLIGHSEGGLVAPIATVKSSDIAYIVLLAAPGLPGGEILLQQAELIGKASGEKDTDIVRTQTIMKNAFAILKQETGPKILKGKFHDLAVNSFNSMSRDEQQAVGNTAEMIESQLQQLSTPWFRYFITYDPRPTLKAVSCPVLAINGSKDLQVPARENLGEIAQALQAGANKDYTVKELPDLNHLLQTCQTGLPSEYGNIQETISPAVLEITGDWILKHTTLQKSYK